MIVAIARIQAEVARKFKVPRAVMTEDVSVAVGKTGRNAFEVSHPRQVAMYLAFTLTRHSKKRIGDLFGGRDHSTVWHAVRAVEKRMKKDRVLRLRVQELKKLLLSVENPASLYLLPTPSESSDCLMDKPKAKPPAYKRHKEDPEEQARFKAAYRSLMNSVAYEPKVREDLRVRRDPCIKCGVRGDVGCVHTRVAA